MMDVLSEGLKGASGESEASRRLRELWEKAWKRAIFQVMSLTLIKILHCTLVLYTAGRPGSSEVTM